MARDARLTRVGREALERLEAKIGTSFSLATLIGYVESGRDKHLRIEEDDMPLWMTGYAVALKDCDLIATRRGLSEIQKWGTQFHEIGHFIKGDVPKFSRGAKTTIYDKFIQRRDRHSIVTPRQRLHELIKSVEDDAEIIGRKLMEYVGSYSTLNHSTLDDLGIFTSYRRTE